jgi:hypothetical protein
VGQRGLTNMMGGNELIIKKEKNKLEEELVREDWMNKPETEMSEDEKTRLREFEQRVKDSIDKQKKQWDVNLKRVKAEIVEIKAKFEENLLSLYKKRIFFDARIYEQELYIVRLTSFLHDVKATKENNITFVGECELARQKFEAKRNFLHICIDKQNEFDQKMRTDGTISAQEQRMARYCGQEKLDWNNRIKKFINDGKATCHV